MANRTTISTKQYWLQPDELNRRLYWLFGFGIIGILVSLSLFYCWNDIQIVQTISHWKWVETHRHLLKMLSAWGMYVFYLIFACIILYTTYHHLQWPRRVALGWLWAELFGAGLFVSFIKYLTGRARPSKALDLGGIDQWIGAVWQPAYHSFPSGHTADLFVSATFIVLLLRSRCLGILAWILALAVALSRIALARHYLSDVLVGAIIAGVFILLVTKFWLYQSKP